MKGAQPPDSAPEWELFDMRKDPREMHNISSDPKYASVVKQLKGELEKVQKEAADTAV
jgi:hypothetical protein